jgi:ubiquinone/menaquinone biosynthesis C-methylase UbiE
VTERRVTYIHGTEPSEQHRLAELNRLTNETFVAFLDVPAGARVLEVGSGLGILARRLAEGVADARVVGVELAAAQIAAAGQGSLVAFVQGDAHALPLAAGAFDLVYARYLLEHVRDPHAVLVEMRRVLRPGGRVAVMENDISLARFDPDCPAYDTVWDAFARLQVQLGGDGTIGRRLFGLLYRAGFEAIELSVQPEVHWHGSPAWIPWVTNIIGNVESARVALIERRLCTKEQVDAAVAELRALMAKHDASAIFVWNRALATK